MVAGALVLAACVCWGLDNHLTALIDGVTPTHTTFWKGTVAGLTNLGVGLVAAPFVATGTVAVSALLVGTVHSHPHWPDLHHRHGHRDSHPGAG